MFCSIDIESSLFGSTCRKLICRAYFVNSKITRLVFINILIALRRSQNENIVDSFCLTMTLCFNVAMHANGTAYMLYSIPNLR